VSKREFRRERIARERREARDRKYAPAALVPAVAAAAGPWADCATCGRPWAGEMYWGAQTIDGRERGICPRCSAAASLGAETPGDPGQEGGAA